MKMEKICPMWIAGAARFLTGASLLGIMVTGLPLHGQEQVYQRVYRTAMSDSVITADEQKLLDGLRVSLELSEDEVLEISRSFVLGDTTKAMVNHEGRSFAIATAMGYGNGLYGLGIPYLMDVEDGRIYLGFQGIMAAGGFYYAWNATKNMDLPLSRISFVSMGSTMALYSTFVLTSAVGFERWFDFDEDAKVMITYAMLAVPMGIKYTDRLYHKWKPSNGLTQFMSTNMIIGAYNGYTAYTLVSKYPDEIENPEAYLRGIIITPYAGALLGAWGTYHLLNRADITMGDAYFYSIGSVAGGITAQRLISFFEIDGSKKITALSAALIDAGMYAAYQLGKDVNLTRGDAVIVALGGSAGLSLLRGTAYLLDTTDAEIMPLLDIAAMLGGGYTAFRYLVSAPKFNTGLLDQTDIRIFPTLLTMDKKPQTGLGLEIRW